MLVDVKGNSPGDLYLIYASLLFENKSVRPFFEVLIKSSSRFIPLRLCGFTILSRSPVTQITFNIDGSNKKYILLNVVYTYGKYRASYSCVPIFDCSR